MRVYAESFPQEKLYMQFDKKAYNTGERIWYKAYLFSGFDPSPFSKNLYTELYDAYGNLLQRNTTPVFESVSSGSFDLPVQFQGTRIHIRAFTSWMLNFDTSFIYTKDIRITIPASDSSKSVAPAITTLHFLPEGGDMIAGNENNMAFIAIDDYGNPQKITGILFDQTGKALLNFNSNAHGMGKFLIIPDKQDLYYATWKDEKGIEHRTDLPLVKNEGVTLRILYTGHKLNFTVSRSPAYPVNEKMIVVAHMNQQMVYKAYLSLKDNLTNGGNIPTDQLPTGILQVTLFDINEKPLAERVLFINNHNYRFDGALQLTTKSLIKRGRNVLEFNLPDTLKSNLSLAITDAEVDGNKPEDDNIITRMLLTGDLHGILKDPYYYFSNASDSLSEQLDLVMLTHGWRKINWQMLYQGKTPQIKYHIEDFISLNAEVLGVDNSRIAKDESITVIFQNKDSSSKLLEIPRLSNGKFSLTGLIFYDTAKAYYQFTQNTKLSNEAAVIFRNGLYTGPKNLHPFNMSLPVWSADDSSLIRKNRILYDEISRLGLLSNSKIQNLQLVTIKGRVKSDKQKLDELYSSGLFSGGNATIFDLNSDPTALGALDIFTYLQGKVAGLQIINGGGGPPTLSWRGATPGLYLDEIPVDPSTMKTISVPDIAMVKVFTPGTGGFSNGAGGVIAVYTKKGSDRPPDPNVKGLEMARILGYAPLRIFFSPDYLRFPEPDTFDSRTTLYWNPNIMMGKENKKLTVPFYNSDVTHQLRIIIEGFNAEGKLLHMEQVIQ